MRQNLAPVQQCGFERRHTRKIRVEVIVGENRHCTHWHGKRTWRQRNPCSRFFHLDPARLAGCQEILSSECAERTAMVF
jgi:hypothetical protein